MKRVAALYRLSSKKQVKRKHEDEVDIPSQKRAIATFLSAHPDWELIEEYQEAGVSAFKKSAEQREVLQQALTDARNSKWSVLICFKPDRLSRAGFGYLDVLDDFCKAGVEVWSASDNRLLSLEDEQLIIRAAEAYTSNMESKKTSDRVRTRMWQLAEDGRWLGGRIPFGYSLKQKTDGNGNVVVRGGYIVQELVPGEYAQFVVEVFEKYVAGWGIAKIAGWLNELNVPCFRADSWSKNAVSFVLSNPLYMGRVVYGRQSNGDREPITVQGRHPALISLDLWEQAQALRKAKQPLAMRERSGVHAMSGVTHCAVCGATMGARTQRNPRKSGGYNVFERYQCNASLHRKTCPTGTVSGKKLEENLVSCLESLSKPTALRSLLESMASDESNRYENAVVVRDTAIEQLAVIERALKKLDKLYLEDEVLTLSEYRAKREEYLQQKQSLESVAAQPLPEGRRQDVTALTELAKDIRKLWFSPNRTNEERKSFLLAFVNGWNVKIIVHPDASVEIVPRTEEPESLT